MRKTLCVITIGQSPRIDMHDTFNKYIPHVKVIEKGILDSYAPSEINAFKPKSDQTLVTRLRDGTEVQLDKAFVDEEVKKLITSCQNENFDAILIACTGKFELYESTKPILYPDYLVSQCIKGLFRNKKIGVVIPLIEQRTAISSKWEEAEIPSIIDACSPYQTNLSAFQEIAERMDRLPVHGIVLDCMGYDDRMKAQMSQYTTKPILLSRNLVFAALAELF